MTTAIRHTEPVSVCIFLTNLGKLRRHIRLLLGFFQIIVLFGIFQVTLPGNIGRLFFPYRQKLFFGIWVSLQPQTTKAVLYHIANNPVWCKKLGCCMDVFFCDLHILFQSSKNIVFFLTVILLIQSIDNLDSIFPVVLWYQFDHLLNDTFFSQQMIRQKNLGIRSFFMAFSYSLLSDSLRS